MTGFLIIALLAAVAGLVATQKGLPWGRPALLVATLIALALGSWSLVARLRPPSSAEQARNAQAAAGRALAEQVAAQVGAGHLLVLTYAPVAGERWFTDLRLEGLTNALAGKGFQFSLAGPNMAPQGSPDASFTVLPRDTLSAGVAGWLDKNKDVKAIVSLLPFPPLDFSSRGLPLYAFAVNEMPQWQAAVRAGTTKAVLVSRPTIMKPDGPQADLAWSDLFELVTPENLAGYLAGKAAH